MLDHHLQRGIVFRLAFKPSARFSDLKPGDVDNKLFTYHLKKVLKQGYVKKSDDGLYSLTPEGRRLSTGVLDDHQALVVERPLSALFLIIRRKTDGAWLLYERTTYPMLGFQGFMHCHPSSTLDCEEVAKEQCRVKNGLTGDFTALGGGYIRVYQNEKLESFTHFTLLYCDDVQGELVPNDPHAEYSWVEQPDFAAQQMFPSSPMLKQFYEDKKQFFVERTFTI
jgi:hypothetical protein